MPIVTASHLQFDCTFSVLSRIVEGAQEAGGWLSQQIFTAGAPSPTGSAVC